MVIWDNRRAIQLNNNRYMELKTKHKKEIRLWQFSWRRTLTCHNSINYWFMHHPASLRIETCRKFGEQERCVIIAPGTAKSNFFSWVLSKLLKCFNCFITFSMGYLFADIISVSNWETEASMHATEFDSVSLPAVLQVNRD